MPTAVLLTLRVAIRHGPRDDDSRQRQSQPAGDPGSYAAIQRAWQDGDVVEIRLPMQLRFEPLPGEAKTVAFLYGPVVLAGMLGKEGIERLEPYAKNQLQYANVPSPAAPGLVCELDDLLRHVEPVAGQPLTFTTRGIGRPHDVTLIPYYLLHYQRYSVYWKVYSEDEWKMRKGDRCGGGTAAAMEPGSSTTCFRPTRSPRSTIIFSSGRAGRASLPAATGGDALGWFIGS